MSELVRNRLAQEWPKQCTKCATFYTQGQPTPTLAFRAKWWGALPVVQKDRGRFGDEFAEYELRNCSCGTTLCVVIAVNDLTKE